MTQSLAHILPQKFTEFFKPCTANFGKTTALITAVAFAALGIASVAGSVIATVLISKALFAFAALCAFSLSIGLFVSTVKGFSSESRITPQYLTEVMQHTLTDLKNGQYLSPNGQTHQLNMQPAIQGTYFLPSAGNRNPRPGNFPLRISVKSQDCLYVAQELYEQGSNPFLVDNANGNDIGGGYKRGASAQEEEICRRSGLSVAIDPLHGMQTQNYYPLNQVHAGAGLYVPNVLVFRAGADRQYAYLDAPFPVAVAVSAALCFPQLDGRLRLNDADAYITRERVRTILEMAYQNGHRSLVLGAFGCGAFGNPPAHVAEIFLDVISKEYPHCFEEIVFAILEDHNTGRAHNPEGNFIPFKRAVDAFLLSAQ